MEDQFRAPVDYDQMAQDDYDFVRMIVARSGVVEIDDATQEIIARFMEKDYLSMYDPEHTATHEGTTYNIRWRRFVESNVQMRVQGLRDRERRRWQRERLICDVPSLDDEDDTTWIETIVDATADIEAEMDLVELIEAMRAKADEVPVRGKRNARALLELLLEQVFIDGRKRPDRKALAEHFGVSDTAVGNMIKELRECLTN